MKKLVLSLPVIVVAALCAWMPAEKTAVPGNTKTVDKNSMLAITPIASYSSFSATVTGFPTHTVTYDWTTTSEANVSKFRIFRKDISTSVVVTTDVNAKSSSLPRFYSHSDNSVINGTTYEYSVCAISADGTLGSGSEATSVIVPMSAR